MRKKWFIAGTASAVILSMVVAGCATAGGSAGTGAAIGALAGGIIGHQSGHAWEGAAIGAAVGALAGWGIHKLKTRQTKTAEQTQEEYNYAPSDGFKMDLRDSTVAPGDVTPGSTVTAKMEYATMGTGNGVTVQEARVLKKDGEVLAELDKESVTRTDGTWENALEFKVPKNAETGSYVLTQQVSAEGQTLAANTAFDVKTATADAGDPAPIDWQAVLAAAH